MANISVVGCFVCVCAHVQLMCLCVCVCMCVCVCVVCVCVCVCVCVFMCKRMLCSACTRASSNFTMDHSLYVILLNVKTYLMHPLLQASEKFLETLKLYLEGKPLPYIVDLKHGY